MGCKAIRARKVAAKARKRGSHRIPTPSAAQVRKIDSAPSRPALIYNPTPACILRLIREFAW
jgi:hypothetical protein